MKIVGYRIRSLDNKGKNLGTRIIKKNKVTIRFIDYGGETNIYEVSAIVSRKR